MCCGKPAEHLVDHQFYYDPVSLMVLGLVLPKLSRWLSGNSAVAMMVPLCGSHQHRFRLTKYLGYGLGVVALLFVPLMILFTYTKQATAQGWMAVILIPIVLSILAAMLALRLLSPRLVEIRDNYFGFTSVSPEFAGAFGGSTAPSGGFKLRELLIAGGFVGGCAVVMLAIIFVMSMAQKRNDDKFFADAHAKADANQKQFMEENRRREEAMRNGTLVNEAEKISKMSPAERDAYFRQKAGVSAGQNQNVPGNPPGAVKPPPVVAPPVVAPPVVAPPVVTKPVVEPNESIAANPPTTPDPPVSKVKRGLPRAQVASETNAAGEFTPPPMCVSLPPNTKLAVGEEVWSLWGSFWYPAVVVETSAEGVKVHYDKYSDTFDEVKEWKDLAIDEAILNEIAKPAAVVETPLVSEKSATNVSRQWVDKTGKFKIEGQLVKFENGQVTLLKADGKEIVVPFDRLSTGDQEFLTKTMK